MHFSNFGQENLGFLDSFGSEFKYFLREFPEIDGFHRKVAWKEQNRHFKGWYVWFCSKSYLEFAGLQTSNAQSVWNWYKTDQVLERIRLDSNLKFDPFIEAGH